MTWTLASAMADELLQQEDHVVLLLSELYSACAYDTERDSRTTTWKSCDSDGPSDLLPRTGATPPSHKQVSEAILKHKRDDKPCRAVEWSVVADLLTDLTNSACEYTELNDGCEQSSRHSAKPVAHPLAGQSCVSLPPESSRVFKSGDIASQDDGIDQYVVKLLCNLTNSACRYGLVHSKETAKERSETGSDDVEEVLDSICLSISSDVPIIHRLLKRRGLSIDQWRTEVEDSCMLRSYDDLATSRRTLGTRPDTDERVVRHETTTTARVTEDGYQGLTLPLSQNRERLVVLRSIARESVQLTSPCAPVATHIRDVETVERTLAIHHRPPTLRRSSFWTESAGDNIHRALSNLGHGISQKEWNCSKTHDVVCQSDNTVAKSLEHENRYDAKRRKWKPLQIRLTSRRRSCSPGQNTSNLQLSDVPAASDLNSLGRTICRKRPAQFSTPPLVRCTDDVLPRAENEVSTGVAVSGCPEETPIYRGASRTSLGLGLINQLNNSERKAHQRPQTTVSKCQMETEPRDSGWATAAGSSVHAIPRDPQLAAEWQSASDDKPEPNGNAAMFAERRQLKSCLAEVKKDIEAIELAHKVENQGEDRRLSMLIEKWRTVSQTACDDIFASTSARLKDLGGFAARKQLKQGGVYREATSGKSGQDDFALTTEEAELMGIEGNPGRKTDDCDGYTMNHLLTQLDIPIDKIRWDPDAGDWY